MGGPSGSNSMSNGGGMNNMAGMNSGMMGMGGMGMGGMGGINPQALNMSGNVNASECFVFIKAKALYDALFHLLQVHKAQALCLLHNLHLRNRTLSASLLSMSALAHRTWRWAAGWAEAAHRVWATSS